MGGAQAWSAYLRASEGLEKDTNCFLRLRTVELAHSNLQALALQHPNYSHCLHPWGSAWTKGCQGDRESLINMVRANVQAGGQQQRSAPGHQSSFILSAMLDDLAGKCVAKVV